MTEDGKEDFESVAPDWWLTRLNELWLRTWRIIGEDAVTDEDRRDAAGGDRRVDEN